MVSTSAICCRKRLHLMLRDQAHYGLALVLVCAIVQSYTRGGQLVGHERRCQGANVAIFSVRRAQGTDVGDRGHTFVQMAEGNNFGPLGRNVMSRVCDA